MSGRSSFSETLKAENSHIWDAIYSNPFLNEIKDGSLPLHKFSYYLIQDYLYLEAFARSVALALAKAPNSEILESLAKRVTTPIERPLHRQLMPLVGIDLQDVEEAPLSPTTTAYSNHLLKVASFGSLGSIAAALLPCPWTYHELGEVIGRLDHPIYGLWSAVYVDGFLAESVKAWKGLVDQCALQASYEELSMMRDAFRTSSRYELAFWNMAYDCETWSV